MKKSIKVFVVEDHPMMVDGYKKILDSFGREMEIIISTANNCKEAFQIITSSNFSYDIVILDIHLPSYKIEGIDSGEELAFLIRKLWNDTKIMIVTSHTETLLLFTLIKKINPEAVLIKSDFSTEEFHYAFHKVNNGETYYTITARQSLKDIYVDNNYLDAYNRRIILLLARGISTKNLPEHLNITISAIDKRKAQIKEIFNIVNGRDEDILREARNRGLI